MGAIIDKKNTTTYGFGIQMRLNCDRVLDLVRWGLAHRVAYLGLDSMKTTVRNREASIHCRIPVSLIRKTCPSSFLR